MSVEAVTLTNEDAARRRIGATAALAALVVLLMLISLGIGPVRLSPLSVAEALFGGVIQPAPEEAIDDDDD